MPELNPIPNHIAIIMDGNGRWAKKHGKPRFEGHRKGVEVVEDIVEASRDMGVRHLTLYAFSDENWSRPKEEIESLMRLLACFVKEKCQKMLDNGISFKTIGDVSRLPADVLAEVDKVKDATARCSNMDLILALSYGSQQEIVRAFNLLLKSGKSEVTTADISQALDTRDIPDPDLLIRTSGEYRISNFLLWQLAYTELYFTDLLWPEFDRAEFGKAIDNYKGRERRFGKVLEE